MYLAATIVLFLAFLGNVLLGSIGGGAPLGDVGEVLLLAGVAVCFVITILRAERARRHESDDAPSPPPVPADSHAAVPPHTPSDPDVRR